MTAIVMAALPSIVVFILLQKFIVKGVVTIHSYDAGLTIIFLVKL